MKNLTNLLLLLPLFAGCAGAPSMPPIDNALLADLPSDAMRKIDAARAARDAALDQLAVAGRATETAREHLKIATAAQKTAQSRLEEQNLIAELTKKNGSPVELQKAMDALDLSRIEAGVRDTALSMRESAVELAEMEEQLADQHKQLSLASIELTKAEALQNVDLVAAQKIAVPEYRKVVTYYRETIASLGGEVEAHTARLDEMRSNLADKSRMLETMQEAARKKLETAKPSSVEMGRKEVKSTTQPTSQPSR